jgi:phosphohistidine swiveling domain-containing protein
MRYAWDNSNIVESYPGVCSPLTFSFARYVYREVYRQTAMLFGVDRRLIDKKYRKLETFLGYFDGRFYYNLETWCTLIANLPGFSANPALLQEMMGVRPDDRISVPPSKTPPLTALRLAFIFAYHHFALPGMTARWIADFDRDFRETVRDLDSAVDGYDALNLYCAVEYRYLRDWQIPILNDFAVMVYSGLLRSFSRKYLGHELEPARISHIGGGGTARMVAKLREIAQVVRADRRLLAEMQRLSHAQLWEEMNSRPQVRDQLQAFLADFGLRNGHDLKLETPNLEEDPALFVELIKQYVQAGATRPTADGRKRKGYAPDESAHLSLPKRLVVDYFAGQAKRAMRRREEMRLKRSQIFGAMRKIFLKMGSYLAERGVIPERDDVFFLEMDEILQLLQGTSTTQDVRPVVAQRKRELAVAEGRTVRPHFRTSGIPSLDGSWRVSDEREVISGELSGIPNYPGVVTGEVVVMERPDFSQDVKNKILVCQQTDPSWVPFLGLIAALVVERGGILSHAAIVSRELKVPSIIGVANATRVLRSGQMVTLDSKVGKVVAL